MAMRLRRVRLRRESDDSFFWCLLGGSCLAGPRAEAMAKTVLALCDDYGKTYSMNGAPLSEA